jgi:predicted CXXCH cytochrome family protein
VARPFEFEHAIIKTEGCTACHSPHGGPNSHMLNRARVNTICLLCHFPPQISSNGHSLVQAHDTTAKGQPCTNCHADIHGSDMSAVFLKKK